MKLVAIALLALAYASWAQAPAPTASPKARLIIGLDKVKRDTSGLLSVQNGALRFKAQKAEIETPVSAIDDIFIGAETTQSGGKTGRVVKTAAIAAPFESGKALTIMMRTKVDILTVAFHDSDGAMHGAIFALPKGQAEPMRAQLIQAGAHASPAATDVSERSKP
ncbi:MAG: hypothetical protein ACLPWF_15650 [Bryobacteraceae bacterium]